MEFRILGPVEAVSDGRVVDLPAPQLRALLARLLLGRGNVVSTDDLLEALWEQSEDASVRNLRVYVSRLRKILGADVVHTRAPGYVLQTASEQVDADRFERLVADGRQLLADGRPAEAAEALRTALALWRGPALADQRERLFALPEAVRLDNARLDALEERVEADLECGAHAPLVAELRGLVAAHPLRERLWRQRMIAEYRSGQAAEALRTFQELRTVMADQVGLDPSAEAFRLERSILDQDPSIGAPASSPPPAERMVEADDAIRVMLVDDHPLWRSALRAMLERSTGVAVVAEAEDGPGAVAVATEVKPDVILMDLHLPGHTGAEATARIVTASPSTRVLMLSASGEEADVLDAVKSGASGYLLKSGDAEDVLDAVARVSRGEPVFTSSLAGVVLDQLRRAEEPSGLRVRLSAGQRELLRVLADGATLKEAASGLAVDEQTARAEVTAIVERLQAAGRDPGANRLVQTVLFVDLVESTARLAVTGDGAWRGLIARFQQMIGDIARAQGGRVLRDLGDGTLLTFEQPRPALACARAVMAAVAELDMQVRVGAHTGECEVTGDGVLGLAVHIAARVQAQADPGEVLVSHTVHDLVIGSDERFEDRGVRALRGVPGEWRLFALAT